MLHVSIARNGDTGGPLDVVVVVIEGKVVISEVLCWVSRSPFFVHHLNVDIVIRGDTKALFNCTDTLECRRIVLGKHCSDCVGILDRFVDKLDCSNICKVRVGVDDVGNPFKPFVGSLVLIIYIKPS